ncbi:hypothetical protein BJ878DRAFT_483167 [Calycina marina]|uniref:Uncharacterized protein n=1 Tax=Calycina marina TaxID=1763456 RepID=A0A9P7YXI5_9HELO|nr:hypothetical protein BJ878DRAFT_483167 [Calycina marina]
MNSAHFESGMPKSLQIVHSNAHELLLLILSSFFTQQHRIAPVKTSKLSDTSYLNELKGICICSILLESFARLCIELSGLAQAALDHPEVAIREAAGVALVDSVFKRGPRILLPALVSSLYIAVAAQINMSRIPKWEAMVWSSQGPPVHASMSGQIEDYARLAREKLTNVWSWERNASSYDANLWTLPTIFRASLSTCAIFFGTATLRPSFRKYIIIILYVYWILQGY